MTIHCFYTVNDLPHSIAHPSTPIAAATTPLADPLKLATAALLDPAAAADCVAVPIPLPDLDELAVPLDPAVPDTNVTLALLPVAVALTLPTPPAPVPALAPNLSAPAVTVTGKTITSALP